MRAEILKGLSTEQVIEIWEEVDKKKMSTEIATVREFIINELTDRNADAVDKWFDDEMEEGKTLSPRKYLL